MTTQRQQFDNRRADSPLRVSSKDGRDDVLLDAVIDPKHNDIVLNGMGISLYSARAIAAWFESAVKKLERKNN